MIFLKAQIIGTLLFEVADVLSKLQIKVITHSQVQPKFIAFKVHSNK